MDIQHFLTVLFETVATVYMFKGEQLGKLLPEIFKPG